MSDSDYDLMTLEGVVDWAHNLVEGHDVAYCNVYFEAGQIARAMRIAQVVDAWLSLQPDGEATELYEYWDLAEDLRNAAEAEPAKKGEKK